MQVFSSGFYLFCQHNRLAQVVVSTEHRNCAQRIIAAPDKVFPLLEPVREAEWLDGWEYEMIYSASGFGEEGCVFKTAHHHEAETIWVVTKRDETNHRVEFVMTTPDSRVGQLQIQLEDNRDGTTSAHISYTFTALSEEGNRFVDDYTEEAFNHRMLHWERSMNHFLETGNVLKAHGQ